MKQTVKPRCVVYRLIAVAVLAAMPALLCAQTLPESVKQLESSVKNLKSVASSPDEMVEWDKALERFNNYNDTIQNLQVELGSRNDSLRIIGARRDSINKQKSALDSDKAQKAAAVLTRRFNATDVEQARRDMEPLSTDERIASVYNRLGQYESMTQELKAVLDTANALAGRQTYYSDGFRIAYLKSVYGLIQEKLPSELFSPQSYPYLYGVLNEALEAKMNDTSRDLKDIIDKL